MIMNADNFNTVDSISETLKETCVALLVINEINAVGRICIERIISNVNCTLVIGYVWDQDIKDLPRKKSIRYIKLNPFPNSEYTSNQKDFTSIEFYEIVAKKWELFKYLLNEEYKYIIYSDTDVFWMKNPINDLLDTFAKYKNLQLLIQSDSRRLNYLVPCMGFLALQNTEFTKNVIQKCIEIHQANIKKRKFKIGDDEVMREYIHSSLDLNWYRELPQATYPVGALINLYKKRSSFRGMPKINPYIFHANYTIGEVKKTLLLRKFLKQYPEMKYLVRKLPYLKLVIKYISNRIVGI